jgi:hypothetical protein
MQNGGQPYGQPYSQQYGGQYGQPYGQTQQPPMWSSAAPTQPQFVSMGMQNMQQPQMVQQPANTYNLTYNQPLTQQQPAVSNSMDQSAPKPAMPSPVATQPVKTNSNVTNPLTAAQNQVQNPSAVHVNSANTEIGGSDAPPSWGAPGGGSSNPVTAPQTQAQTPVYTPPPTTSGGLYQPNAATQRPSGELAVNGIVARPDGTPDYMRDYTAGAGTPSHAVGLLQGMHQELSPADYNLSPAAPLMNQGQQNLVNLGLDPMIARIYGSRG